MSTEIIEKLLQQAKIRPSKGAFDFLKLIKENLVLRFGGDFPDSTEIIQYLKQLPSAGEFSFAPEFLQYPIQSIDAQCKSCKTLLLTRVYQCGHMGCNCCSLRHKQCTECGQPIRIRLLLPKQFTMRQVVTCPRCTDFKASLDQLEIHLKKCDHNAVLKQYSPEQLKTSTVEDVAQSVGISAARAASVMNTVKEPKNRKIPFGQLLEREKKSFQEEPVSLNVKDKSKNDTQEEQEIFTAHINEIKKEQESEKEIFVASKTAETKPSPRPKSAGDAKPLTQTQTFQKQQPKTQKHELPAAADDEMRASKIPQLEQEQVLFSTAGFRTGKSAKDEIKAQQQELDNLVKSRQVVKRQPEPPLKIEDIEPVLYQPPPQPVKPDVKSPARKNLDLMLLQNQMMKKSSPKRYASEAPEDSKYPQPQPSLSPITQGDEKISFRVASTLQESEYDKRLKAQKRPQSNYSNAVPQRIRPEERLKQLNDAVVTADVPEVNDIWHEPTQAEIKQRVKQIMKGKVVVPAKRAQQQPPNATQKSHEPTKPTDNYIPTKPIQQRLSDIQIDNGIDIKRSLNEATRQFETADPFQERINLKLSALQKQLFDERELNVQAQLKINKLTQQLSEKDQFIKSLHEENEELTKTLQIQEQQIQLVQQKIITLQERYQLSHVQVPKAMVESASNERVQQLINQYKEKVKSSQSSTNSSPVVKIDLYKTAKRPQSQISIKPSASQRHADVKAAALQNMREKIENDQ